MTAISNLSSDEIECLTSVVPESDSASITALSASERKTSVRALALGLIAAATYSVANLALRGLSKSDGGAGWDMWVAGTKAFPTFATAVVLLCLRRSRGQTTFAAWDFVWPIAVAALVATDPKRLASYAGFSKARGSFSP